MQDLEKKIQALPTQGAEHFFRPDTQDIFPEKDFWLCMQVNRFPFILRIEKDEEGFRSVQKKISI